MKEWKDDKTLITLIKAELYTAVIGDIMDKMREKYCGDWNPHWKLTSFTDNSVFRSSSIDLLIRI